jgi:hypothetical protein
MKVIGPFIAAVSTAAIIFDLEFLFEGLLAGEPFSASILLVGFALNVLVRLPAAIIGGVPIWLIFRRRRIHSPLAFVLAGASLALVTYLLLAAAGMGQSSDHPMTFAQNLGRSFHIPRIAFAIFGGAGGSYVFRRIAPSGLRADPRPV